MLCRHTAGTRQSRHIFFLKKLCRVPPWRHVVFFFKKLCRVPPCRHSGMVTASPSAMANALGKACSQVPRMGHFAECYGPGIQQRCASLDTSLPFNRACLPPRSCSRFGEAERCSLGLFLSLSLLLCLSCSRPPWMGQCRAPCCATTRPKPSSIVASSLVPRHFADRAAAPHCATAARTALQPWLPVPTSVAIASSRCA
jgi:hypothetical protein